MKKAVELGAIFFIAAQIGFSQYAEDAIRPWWGFTAPSGRAAGMGYSYSSSSGDYLSVFYNPAGIAPAERPSFFFSINNIDLVTRTDFYSREKQRNLHRSQYDGFGLVYPFKTYRGHLAVAVGYAPLFQLDNAFNFAGMNTDSSIYQDYRQTQEGVINSGNLAVGVEFRKNLYVGLAVHFLRGYSDLYRDYLETDSLDIYTFHRYKENFEIKNDYSGMMINVGLLYSPLQLLRFGLNLRLPVDLKIHERSVYSWEETFDDGYVNNSSNDYRLTYRSILPPRIDTGVGIDLKPLFISTQISLLNWSQLEFRSHLLDPADSTHFVDRRINDEIRNQFVESHSFLTGAELELIPEIAYVQFGFRQKPYYRKDNSNRLLKINTYSLGTRLIIDRQIALNLSYVYDSYNHDVKNEFLDYYLDIESSRRQYNLAVTFLF